MRDKQAQPQSDYDGGNADIMQAQFAEPKALTNPNALILSLALRELIKTKRHLVNKQERFLV